MYMVSYDLKSGTVDEQDIVLAIRQLGDAMQILDSTWILKSNLTYNQVSAELKKTISVDRYIVVQMYNGNRQGWLAKSMWDWMRKDSARPTYNFHLAYDKRSECPEDNNALISSIVKLLRSVLGVSQQDVCRPSETTLLFYSSKDDKEVFACIDRELKGKAYYSISHFIPSNDTDGFRMNPKTSLSQSLVDLWGD